MPSQSTTTPNGGAESPDHTRWAQVARALAAGCACVALSLPVTGCAGPGSSPGTHTEGMLTAPTSAPNHAGAEQSV